MNQSDCVTVNTVWIDKSTMEAGQEPRRGEIWVAQGYQQLVLPQPG